MKKNKEKKALTGYDLAKLTVIADIPTTPPPFGFTSPFKTIQEWLFHLCDTNLPEKAISVYYFSLIERPLNNLLSLEGFNKYNINDNVAANRIDFIPAMHMFFALPQEEFGDLSQQQMREQVLNELIEFTKSFKFQTSFLSKGNSIRTNFGGEIWSR